MEEQQKQEGQKTVVAFVAGLLIGGLLVWVFSGSAETTEPATMETGDETSETMTDTDDESAQTEDDNMDDADMSSNEDTTDNNDAPAADNMEVGDGSVSVSDQPASASIALDAVTFPTDEGWIGVRSYANGQLGSLLGVNRYSQEQGLAPEAIQLQVPTEAGNEYAIVFYTESGDREFSLADDVQIDEVFATFSAQ